MIFVVRQNQNSATGQIGDAVDTTNEAL